MVLVEYEKDQVFVTVDQDGLAFLIDELTRLKGQEWPEHLHLNTPAWAGDEIVDDRAVDGQLVHHMRVQFFAP